MPQGLFLHDQRFQPPDGVKFGRADSLRHAERLGLEVALECGDQQFRIHGRIVAVFYQQGAHVAFDRCVRAARVLWYVGAGLGDDTTFRH